MELREARVGQREARVRTRPECHDGAGNHDAEVERRDGREPAVATVDRKVVRGEARAERELGVGTLDERRRVFEYRGSALGIGDLGAGESLRARTEARASAGLATALVDEERDERDERAGTRAGAERTPSQVEPHAEDERLDVAARSKLGAVLLMVGARTRAGRSGTPRRDEAEGRFGGSPSE